MSNLILRIISSSILAPILILAVYLNGSYYYTLLLLIFLFSSYEIYKLNILNVKIALFFIIVFFIYSLYRLRGLDANGGYIFLIIFITWLTDLGGYIFGKLFGRKKIKIISPNKTYIGFFGSVLMSILIMPILPLLNIKIYDILFLQILFILSSSLFVILGDLFFSYVKRINNIKDYSMLIPGHGGILDRIDGLIFLTIFYQFFFIL